MKNGSALLVCMLCAFSAWGYLYAAAESSTGQVTLFKDADDFTSRVSEVLGESSTFQAVDLPGEDPSAKRQRTVRSSGPSPATVAQLSAQLSEVGDTIALLRKSLEESDAGRRQTEVRIQEMGQEIARLQSREAHSVEAIKQLSTNTVLVMAEAACEVQAMQGAANMHIKLLCDLGIPHDDEAIQVIYLATAKRFCDEVSTCSGPERSSLIMCANRWLNKIKCEKLPVRLHWEYQDLRLKIPPATIPLPSFSFGHGLL